MNSFDGNKKKRFQKNMFSWKYFRWYFMGSDLFGVFGGSFHFFTLTVNFLAVFCVQCDTFNWGWFVRMWAAFVSSK